MIINIMLKELDQFYLVLELDQIQTKNVDLMSMKHDFILKTVKSRLGIYDISKKSETLEYPRVAVSLCE